MIVTAWNVAITVGGYGVETRGAGVLPWSLCILSVPCLVVVSMTRLHGFLSRRATSILQGIAKAIRV
ncbi:hypothetical protein [Sphingomonas sp. PP-CC-3A-396]|jgi:hypothetical protein|uniref:hypothetical protein n=1 Tax=Sphingomonas sp. PP-CC-3A-396 TaxID=2135655 RepID=UPI0010EC3142|nr:hypothetical protein [Sphingomonas sp. PP-CC-3A-396]TCQ08496.1 hypothetical protein C8J40_103315 [Sphingomonas sp. PP-CC-3A-396]